METKIQMWGNSLGVRIPKALAASAGVEPGAVIRLTLVNGKLVIERVIDREYSLDELLAGVTRQNLHTEMDTGTAVGCEAW
jgi:antitoxin MazE